MEENREDTEIQRILVELRKLRWTIHHLEVRMAGELQALQAQVAQNTSVVDSAITLIGNIKTLLDAAIASGNPAALQALSDTLGAEDVKLANSIAQNTPAAVQVKAVVPQVKKP